ncbi:hypothetical protein FEP46_06054 [Burkholderia multivorans]|nr:hypothetical protein [Burkholderia multivorans]
MNSYNKPTYTVPANDDDLLNKRAAQISKAIRTLGLRIIPGDLQDEAEEIIKMVRHDENAKDPDRARKKMVDAFGSLGVKASDLVEYLGHPLDTCSPQEMADMFALYGAIKDGEATWKQVMENKAEQVGGPEGGASPAAGKVVPVCSAEEFEKKKAGWRKQIVEKTKTPSELIAMIETKSRLSDEQRFEVESWSHEND